MTYDSWKATNPDDEFLGYAEQPDTRQITLWADVAGEWHAMFGPFRFTLDAPIGVGMTMAEAIEDLRALEDR